MLSENSAYKVPRSSVPWKYSYVQHAPAILLPRVPMSYGSSISGLLRWLNNLTAICLKLTNAAFPQLDWDWGSWMFFFYFIVKELVKTEACAFYFVQLLCHECKQGCCSEAGVCSRDSILLSVITPLVVAVLVQKRTLAVKTLIKFVVVKVPHCIPTGPELHIIVTGCGIPWQYLNFCVIYGHGGAVLSLVKFCGVIPQTTWLVGKLLKQVSEIGCTGTNCSMHWENFCLHGSYSRLNEGRFS